MEIMQTMITIISFTKWPVHYLFFLYSSVYLLMYLFTNFFTYSFIYQLTCLFIYLLIYLCPYLSNHLFMPLSIQQSICLTNVSFINLFIYSLSKLRCPWDVNNWANAKWPDSLVYNNYPHQSGSHQWIIFTNLLSCN